MKNRARISYVLIALIPLAMGALAWFVVPSGKSHKVHFRTYAQAGSDLQKEFEPALAKEGYGFNVVACYHDKGSKYVCSAYLSKSGTRVCSLIKFTDKTGADVKVGAAGQAKDPSICQ